METIERFTYAKNGNENDNEDRIYMSDRFIAVIDGATSKEDRTLDGLTGGQNIDRIVCRCLDEIDDEPEAFDVFETVEQTIRKEFPREEYWPAAASAAIYNIGRQELWLIGDCQALINGKPFTNSKKIDAVLSDLRSIVLYSEIASGTSTEELMKDDPGRTAILPFLKDQNKLENIDCEWGYVVFANGPYNKDFCRDNIKVIKVPDKAQIVLASDGYPELRDTLKESEDCLKKILEEDPLCFRKFKSTKCLSEGNLSFDDRAYIRIRI